MSRAGFLFRPKGESAPTGRAGSTAHHGVEDLLRALAPQVLGALVRRYGSFDAAEDAVQEALLAAALQWPETGVPQAPRAAGGLSTAQIAAAFLVPEATMAQRISRAKRALRAAGTPLARPGGSAGAARLAAARHVLYLIFNEGYTATGGTALTAPELSTEAIRLTRLLHRLVPEDAETAGLLALMLLTDARRPARTGPNGALVPLAEQDRGLWDRQLIAEGVDLISRTLPRGQAGPYQLQAAIAAVHDEAEHTDATDRPQILTLYTLLERFGPNPVISLNRAIALAMVHGPAAGLDLLARLESDPRLARHHRLLATRAHLLDLLGHDEAAAHAYRAAAARTHSAPERRHLTHRAQRLENGRRAVRGLPPRGEREMGRVGDVHRARRGEDRGMAKTFVFTAAPLLVVGYAGLRVLDGLDGERGPGPAWTAGHLAFLAALVLFVPVLWELRRLAGRGPFATATAGVGLVGAVCAMAQISADLAVGALAADHEAMRAMFARIQGVPGVDLVVYTAGPVLLYVGLLASFCHLARVRAVPVWRAVAVGLAVLVSLLGPDALPAVGLLLCAGLAPYPRRGSAPAAAHG